MSVSKSSAISGVLVVLSQSEDVSRRIESYLRNAGHPLRTGWITELDDLEDVLRRNPPDLVLCQQHLPRMSSDKVISLCADIRPALPVLLIDDTVSTEMRSEALAAGAQDFVAYGDAVGLRHLELVVLREFYKHQQMQKLRLTEERLADFASRHQQLTQSTADPVAYVQEGILIQANNAFSALLECADPSELAGLPLIDLIAEAQRTKIKERLRAVQKGKHNGDLLELDLIGRQGTVQIKAQLILGNVDGESVIELLVRSEARIAVAAPIKSKPGDRSAFAASITTPRTAIAAGLSAAILICIDGFRALEGRIGHAEAEEVAAKVTAAIRARLVQGDMSFTFSIDEVALLIQRPRLDDIEDFGERMRKEIAGDIFVTTNNEAHVTVSVVIHPLSGDELAMVVIRDLADQVRTVSAQAGNQMLVIGATAKAGQIEREESRIAEQVREAIDNNRLKLAYQSIASLEGDSRLHYDILLRMLDETGKEYHAGEFLPAAQKFNLMCEIDRWVIARAYAVIAKRGAVSEPKTLFVKLSEDTLKDVDNFVDWLKPFVADHDSAADIIFEIREGVVQNHMRKAKLLLQALKQMKVKLAIEYFGVNPHSAQLLTHLEISFVKFHPSFTEKFSDRDTQKRLGEFMEIAKGKHIKSIVSHVEDANVMARLWQMGVNFVQGYHVQEPEAVFLTSTPGQ